MFELQHAKHQAAMFQTEALQGMEALYDDELLMLEAQREMLAVLSDWELQLVTRLRDREEPVTWAKIGEALGVSKQGAIQRFGKLMPPAYNAPM